MLRDKVASWKSRSMRGQNLRGAPSSLISCFPPSGKGKSRRRLIGVKDSQIPFLTYASVKKEESRLINFHIPHQLALGWFPCNTTMAFDLFDHNLQLN